MTFVEKNTREIMRFRDRFFFILSFLKIQYKQRINDFSVAKNLKCITFCAGFCAPLLPQFQTGYETLLPLLLNISQLFISTVKGFFYITFYNCTTFCSSTSSHFNIVVYIPTDTAARKAEEHHIKKS